jgi:bifunctional non-homologous end joining protein LigD
MSMLNNNGKSANSILPAQSIIKNLSDKRIFVVHRHLGSILHYDLRIEINGVLKNWAIPKGPSMNPGDRRLAILTDDLPRSYAAFKGVVPEGTYGAGIVEYWDKGYCVPHSFQNSKCNDRDMLCQLKEGRLKFTLKGKMLKGVFSLVRISEGSPHWFLIKGNDKYAVSHTYNSENYISGKSTINKYLKAHRDEVGFL